MKMKNITETFYNNLVESKIDKARKIISGVHIMSTSKSANGYSYTDKAMESCARLAEGTKAFLNHTTSKERNERNGVRPIQDWLGTFRNTKKSGSVIKGDLHYREAHESLMEDIIRQNPAAVGFSIDAQVKMESDEQGKEQVSEMVTLRSCDLVISAAMVQGLFENKKKNKNEFTIEDLARKFMGEKTQKENETITENAAEFLKKINK